MRNNFNLMLYVWMTFTALLVVSLAINGIRALSGHATFAYWHIGALLLACLMTAAQWSESPAEQRFRLILLWKRFEMKAAKAYSNLLRAVRSLPALFSFKVNHFQTEP